MKDLSNGDGELVTILDHTNSDSYVIENEGSKLYIVTNLEAPNKKVVTCDAANPAPENWVDFIPETENVLSISTGDGYFFAKYMVDALSQVNQYDADGKLIREVKLPGLGTASGFGSKKEKKTYTSPLRITKLQERPIRMMLRRERMKNTGLQKLILIQNSMFQSKYSIPQRMERRFR